MPNPVLGETCTADLSSVSEEKENICSQTDKIYLTNCDTELTAQAEAQGSPPRKRAKNFDAECVIMGAELSDITINYALELLKLQFKELNGLQSTILQEKKIELLEAQVKNKLQISKRLHWIVASTVNCKFEEVQVYDSLFRTMDKETKNTTQNLFQARSCKGLVIKLVRCQKQTGGKDCGLFSIAFATAIAFHTKITNFHQELMRTHLVECLNKSTCHHFLVSKNFPFVLSLSIYNDSH